MAINAIQFQKGLSIEKFMKEYGSEEQCEEALVAARWPQGFKCPCCAHELAYEFRRRQMRYWQCKACRHQVSLRVGTMMENSKLLHIPRQTGHPFHVKLDTHSTSNWTPIPRQTGHPFHVKLDTQSSANWTLIPLQTGQFEAA